MAMSQTANVAERIVGHGDNADITTDVTNYAKGDYGEETSTRIKATIWQGKKSVKIGALILIQLLNRLADTGSRNAQTEGYRRRRCHYQDNREYDMWK